MEYYTLMLVFGSGFLLWLLILKKYTLLSQGLLQSRVIMKERPLVRQCWLAYLHMQYGAIWVLLAQSPFLGSLPVFPLCAWGCTFSTKNEE